MKKYSPRRSTRTHTHTEAHTHAHRSTHTHKLSEAKAHTSIMVAIEYAVPVKADKVVRSRKYGQETLRQMAGVQRIFVDDRSKAFFNSNGIELVKVIITAKTKAQADACYAKAKEMIMAIMKEEKATSQKPQAPSSPKTERTYKGYYDVPEEGDKVFRSPKHGQKILKEHHPDCRIKVCDRNKTGTVRVIIFGPSKRHTDSCFREGEQMVNELLKETPRSERANPAKPLTLEENFEEFVKGCKKLVRIRELMGFENHDCCPEVMQLIAHRESQGITDHSEIGKCWEPKKPMVRLDDILGYEVPADDWAEYMDIHWRVQQENPHLKVV